MPVEQCEAKQQKREHHNRPFENSADGSRFGLRFDMFIRVLDVTKDGQNHSARGAKKLSVALAIPIGTLKLILHLRDPLAAFPAKAGQTFQAEVRAMIQRRTTGWTFCFRTPRLFGLVFGDVGGFPPAHAGMLWGRFGVCKPTLARWVAFGFSPLPRA